MSDRGQCIRTIQTCATQLRGEHGEFPITVNVDVAFIIFRNSVFQSWEAKVESDALSDRPMYKTEIQKKLSIFMH